MASRNEKSVYKALLPKVLQELEEVFVATVKGAWDRLVLLPTQIGSFVNEYEEALVVYEEDGSEQDYQEFLAAQIEGLRTTQLKKLAEDFGRELDELRVHSTYDVKIQSKIDIAKRPLQEDFKRFTHQPAEESDLDNLWDKVQDFQHLASTSIEQQVRSNEDKERRRIAAVIKERKARGQKLREQLGLATQEDSTQQTA